jgi:hypothetical protein
MDSFQTSGLRAARGLPYIPSAEARGITADSGNKETEKIFNREFSRKLPPTIQRVSPHLSVVSLPIVEIVEAWQ